jgi:hypothetical protein
VASCLLTNAARAKLSRAAPVSYFGAMQARFSVEYVSSATNHDTRSLGGMEAHNHAPNTTAETADVKWCKLC